MLVLAVLTVPDERGLCQNRAQSHDPHHMGCTGCYFSGPMGTPQAHHYRLTTGRVTALQYLVLQWRNSVACP